MKKTAAERILAFRNPCHRFHPQRMYGEHGRDKGAAPGRAGNLLQEQEKQNHSECVQKNIREMMAAGVSPYTWQSSMWESEVRGCQLPA